MVRRLTFLAALLVASVFLSGGSYDRGGYATSGGYIGSNQAEWVTVKVAISPDTAYQDPDSLAVNGGPYDYIINESNHPGEFLRGYIQMNSAALTEYNSSNDRCTAYGSDYWSDWSVAISMVYLPLDDLPGFYGDVVEVMSATYITYWRQGGDVQASGDTLFVVGANSSDITWPESGNTNCNKNYMNASALTTWPQRNSSTDPRMWGAAGGTDYGFNAISDLSYSDHGYVVGVTTVANDSVSFDVGPWLQSMSDGDNNGGLWHMGTRRGGGAHTFYYNALTSSDAAANRPRLIVEYRYRSEPSSPQQLAQPAYASWSQHANTNIGSAYYDSLAAVDVSVLHLPALELSGYTNLVDSVRVRNPGWIPLFYVYAYGMRRDYESAAEGTLYNDLWLAIEDNDYWARDTVGNKVPHDPSYPDYDMFDYGNPGLADALAKVYIKHLNERNNLRHNVGFFVDWFELPLRPWALDLDAVDLNRNAIAYSSDAAAENLLIDSYIKEFPSALRNAAGRDDFLVVANGTVYQTEYQSFGLYNYLFDGGMYENYYLYFPMTFDQFNSVMTENTALFDNSRVNPPLALFQAAHDSVGFTSEALSIIAGGVAVFGNDARAVDGIETYLDQIVADPARQLNLGERVAGAVWITESDSISFAKFWDGTDTTYVRVQGYQDPDTSAAGDHIGLPFPYEIIKGAGEGIADTLSIGSRALR